MAASGRSPSSTRGTFTPRSVSVRTAKEVTSLPVPAVVGMHHRGGLRRENQHMALAQSMGEPPPKAATTSGWKASRAATPSATRRREGSGSTLSKTSTGPVSRSAARPASPEEARKPSVTSSTRFPARASSSARAPGPKVILGLIENRSIPTPLLFALRSPSGYRG